MTGSKSRPARACWAQMLALAGISLASVAQASEPLYVKNLSPVAGLFGLPSQRAADTTAPSRYEMALHSSVASHYVNESSASEYLNLDGETVRLAFELRYGIADDWDVQLEVPWLDQSGGKLDSAIDNWHDFWGMSDGGRSSVPRDILDYHYLSPDTQFSLQDDRSGVGDISLSLTRAFYRQGDTVASAVLGYKAGTGDEQDFLGSGADDAYLALRVSGLRLLSVPLFWHGQLGYLRAGNGDLLDGSQERNFWFAGIAMDWRFARDWSLIAQLDGHAAPMHSELTGVGEDAAMGTLGVRWHIMPQWAVDISFIEDIRVETAPDVTFQASVRYRPAG